MGRFTPTFHDVQNEARVFEGMEVQHVPNRAVSQGRTVHRYFILKQNNLECYANPQHVH